MGADPQAHPLLLSRRPWVCRRPPGLQLRLQRTHHMSFSKPDFPSVPISPLSPVGPGRGLAQTRPQGRRTHKARWPPHPSCVHALTFRWGD